MKLNKVLVFYKTSNYEQYVLKEHSAKVKKHRDLFAALRESHRVHYHSLHVVEKSLEALGISFSKMTRGCVFDENQFDLIVTVGGDGTFLEASQFVVSKPILGVNSNPKESIGNFCAIDADQMQSFLQKKNVPVLSAARLKVMIDGKKLRPALNDALITNIHPASTGRYVVKVGRQTEHQKSSGIWISTCMGSTAAILSAGGKKMNRHGTDFQMKVREPYYQKGLKPKLDRLVLKEKQSLKIISGIRDGRVFIDGTKRVSNFMFGSEVVISGNGPKLKIVGLR